jgi:serine phosphatase RsbU (regulator of sigma subunit)
MLQINKSVFTDYKSEKETLLKINQYEKQKLELEDSIRYASYIQSAILPPIKNLFKEFPESFIYFEPKEMVSGDFYWFTRKKDLFFIAVADCTGHGVPGAFMSILGITFLSEIVNQNNIPKANNVLNSLREKVMKALHQNGEMCSQKDGINMAMCIINTTTNELQYAGAYNPLYIIRGNRLEEIKADRMPVGIHAVEETPFKNNYYNLREGDQLYLFTDGYVDQFGGPDEKKFKYRRFKKLLIDIAAKPMLKQYQILHDTYYEWKDQFEQIDDVLVIGLKYSRNHGYI